MDMDGVALLGLAVALDFLGDFDLELWVGGECCGGGGKDCQGESSETHLGFRSDVAIEVGLGDLCFELGNGGQFARCRLVCG